MHVLPVGDYWKGVAYSPPTLFIGQTEAGRAKKEAEPTSR